MGISLGKSPTHLFGHLCGARTFTLLSVLPTLLLVNLTMEYTSVSCFVNERPQARAKARVNEKSPRFRVKLMGESYVIVVFGELSKRLNQLTSELLKSGLEEKNMDDVLECFCCTIEQKSPSHTSLCLLSEIEIQSSTSGSSQHNHFCCDLLTKFTVALEAKLIRREQAFSDAETIKLLPFRSIQKDYLRNLSFVVFRVSFPAHLQDKLEAVLLLFTRVLCKSLEEILTKVQCEYQAVVLQDFSAYIVTENHAVEALVKISEVDNCSILLIVGYNPEKCSTETVKKMKGSIKSNFTAEFSSDNFTIQILDAQQPHNDPSNQQIIKKGVQESQSDSGHITETPVIAGVVYSPLLHQTQLPAEKCCSTRLTCNNGVV